MFFNMFNINDSDFRTADFQRIWRSERVFGHVMRHGFTLIQYDLPTYAPQALIRTTSRTILRCMVASFHRNNM